MLGLLLCLMAIVLSGLLGAHAGRERERRRIVTGQIAQWEVDLLRARRQRIHPNPQMAGRSMMARVSR